MQNVRIIINMYYVIEVQYTYYYHIALYKPVDINTILEDENASRRL